MLRCHIDNVEPFNESSFNNCTYPIKFSILRLHRRPITPVVLNEFHTYGCNYDPQYHRSLLFVNTRFLRDPDDLMSETLGIRELKTLRSDHLLAELKASIAAGHPVMVTIDRYHEPETSHYFHRVHHLHSLLVYGYDDTTSTFNILDDYHQNFGATIVKRKIPYDDMVRAYYSSYELWPEQLRQFPTFIAFSAEDRSTDFENVIASSKASFIAETIERHHLVLQDVQHLHEFVACFRQEARSRDMSPALADVYHGIFSRIAEFKITHQYQLCHLLDGSAIDLRQQSALFKVWARLRLRVLKMAVNLSRENVRTCVDDIITNLCLAADLETSYQRTYIETLKKLQSQRPTTRERSAELS